jgi:hypothetical protein
MPAKFDRLGVTFQYPDNWRLDEEEAVAGNHTVSVYTPDGGGFWTVSIHPRAAEPAKLTRAAVKAMKEEYDSLEALPAEESVVNCELVGYDLNFYCFDLLSSAVVRSFRTDRATLIIFYQAEDRQFDDLRPVFQAITHSLINEL